MKNVLITSVIVYEHRYLFEIRFLHLNYKHSDIMCGTLNSKWDTLWLKLPETISTTQPCENYTYISMWNKSRINEEKIQ